MSASAFLLDSNVWIALTFAAHPAHAVASEALSLASDRCPAVFCRATQQSFLRLASTPAVWRQYATGMTNEDALKVLGRFMASPCVAYRDEPAGLVPLWHRLAERRTASPKVWMDAYLAAFAITGNLTLITLDHDLNKYEQAGLRLHLLQYA